jgi:hypothetical protein
MDPNLNNKVKATCAILDDYLQTVMDEAERPIPPLPHATSFSDYNAMSYALSTLLDLVNTTANALIDIQIKRTRARHILQQISNSTAADALLAKKSINDRLSLMAEVSASLNEKKTALKLAVDVYRSILSAKKFQDTASNIPPLK